MEKKGLVNREAFLSTLPILIKDLVDAPEFSDIPKTNAWAARVLQYNVANSDLHQAMTFLRHYEHLASELTAEDIELSYVLGWCIEFFQSFLLVSNDIVTGAETRGGNPCWHRVEGVELTACNDAMIIEYCMFFVLEKYFKEKSYYLDLVEIFHHTLFMILYGRSLDARVKLETNASSFTEETFTTIAKCKTSFLNLSVALAMKMTGVDNAGLMTQVEDVMKEIGVYHQALEDFHGICGDNEVTQACTEGKCSWVVVAALKLASSEEFEVIMENYGKVDRMGICKELFVRMGIPAYQSEYEKSACTKIKRKISQLPAMWPKELTIEILEDVKQRFEDFSNGFQEQRAKV